MRPVMVVAVLAVVLAAVPVVAQEAPAGRLAQVTYYTVSDADAFEAGLKAHNQFHASVNDPAPIHTFEIISGEQAGQYIRASFGHSWADFDVEMPGDGEDSAKNLDPYIAHAVPAVYESLPELSRFPEGGTMMPFSRIFEFRLHWGQERNFMEAIGKIHAALVDAEGVGAYLWYRLEDGGDLGTWVVSLPRESWAAFAPPEKTIPEIVEEKYGDDAAAVLDAMQKAVVSETRYTIVHRDDLSYMPAAGAEGGGEE